MRAMLALVILGLMVPRVHAGPEWPLFASNRGRTGAQDAGPASIAAPTWVFTTDTAAHAITVVGQSGSVVSRDLVLAVGSITVSSQKQFRLWAIDRRSGTLAWSAPIPTPTLDSWSTPAIDLANRAVLVASASTLSAFDLRTGAPRWQAALPGPVVDASPLVTSGVGVGPQGGQWHGGLGMANRAFITTYDGFGTDASLVCINTDPTHPALNPFLPGQIVWTAPIGGSSGNTPAYSDGLVFVATLGPNGFGAGQILAFPANATTAPMPTWVFDNTIEEGFFGGVCVAPSSSAAHAPASLFAASYAFFGGRTSANLVKLDAGTGALRWSAPCNRTACTPVALGDGRIALSTGLRGYGSVQTLQLFRDQDTSAQLLWDSALDTWTDANANGSMDLGEYLILGGWSVQPAFTTSASAPRLWLGAASTNPTSTAACTDLYAVDTSKLPLTAPGSAQPGYLAQHALGAGSTPAIADANLYTVGATGLFAFGPPPAQCDVNADGVVDLEDLYAWHRGVGARDVNLDGAITDADRTALEQDLRRDEAIDMTAGRSP